MAGTARSTAIRWTELRAKRVRNVAGLMTGTSMDGLDVALCRIRSTPQLGFELVAFETVPLPAELRRRTGRRGRAPSGRAWRASTWRSAVSSPTRWAACSNAIGSSSS